MQLSEAIEQLEDIHQHLTKAEVYPGFRVPGVALAGVVGLVAAALPSEGLGTDEPRGFVIYWVVVALVCAALGGGAALHAYLFREDDFDRRRTRRVLAQFLPCVVAGCLVTLGFVRGGPDLVAFLPGIWSIVFGLGQISARPYLPAQIGLVGIYYLAIGSLILLRAGENPTLDNWSVGGVFGVGHLAAALVLYRHRGETADGY